MLPREAIYLESIGRSLLSYLTENSGRPSQRIVELADQLRTKANERQAAILPSQHQSPLNWPTRD